MAARSDITYFVGDTPEGNVVVLMTLPTGTLIQGPLQTFRVVGFGVITPPKSPMTQQQFAGWRESLESSGFAIDMRFME